MDEGKPTGPKAKWWSRPARTRGAGTDADSDAGTVAAAFGTPVDSAPVAEVPADGARAEDARVHPGPDPAPVDDAAVEDAPAGDSAARGGPVVNGAVQPARSVEGRDDARMPEADAPQDADPARPDERAHPAVAVAPGSQTAGPGEQPQQISEPADQRRPQPRHAPDPYSTPPYGGPGPWALAPPVQRPVPTPPQGTAVPQGPPAANGASAPTQPPPPYAEQPPQPHTSHQPQPPQLQPHVPHQPQPHLASHTQPVPQPHPAPHTQPVPQPQLHQPSQWLQYDPWGAPQQPLTHPGSSSTQGARGGSGRGRGGRRGTLLVGALLIALTAGGVGGGIGAYIERNGGLTTVELPQADKAGDAGSKGRAPDSVAGIAASALPSVVTLHVSGAGEQGTGTGFVLDGQGHILTNNHVVEPAGAGGTITITFSGGETAKAKVVGKDSGYDLAVVKVTGVAGLKPLPLGNSDNVQVGDPVVAIGAPFDLQNTVTSGIISAKERPITAGGEKGDGSDVSYVNALQTDAPINPGNSGGPLVNSEAHVIGVNSAIRAADTGSELDGGQGGSIGLGFAIPINQAKRVAEELINKGSATHPVIGVTLDMQYTGDGARVGTKGSDGPAVTPDGPGAKAGIRPRDVITEVDGQRVHNGQELIVKIRAHRPGDRLELTVTRGDRKQAITVTLGSADGT
ncbi:trypsin-like peptidase domain-containing protein [Streptomyces sp. A5-4]|uniref:S1C family serine protease n=1 Tax=Streptomyces sp. A5-4 TaxID=3384771 RepID=UPI003DA7B0FD